MNAPEVTFADIGLDARQEAIVRSGLRRIPFDTRSGAWPSRVDHIEVVRVLSGGQSGALVLEVVLHRGNLGLLAIAKVGPSGELADEWQAYHEVIRRVRTAMFAPIVAATPDVVEPAEGSGGSGAVVYDHAARFAGRRNVPVRTLEEIVRSAFDGSSAALDDALAAIELLFGGTADVLYHRFGVTDFRATLRSANPTLGPNITIMVDDGDHDGVPRPDAYPLLPDDEVLQRTVGTAGSTQLADGDDIALEHLHPKAIKKSVLLADGDPIVVAIQAADPGVLSALSGRTDIQVHGRVLTTRGAEHRSRMLGALTEAGPVRTGDDWALPGVTVADPFRVLFDVLTEPVVHRVTSAIHGDLNPRNALLVDNQPCLIDYSHTVCDGPQQADFCWLELGLLRDVFAGMDFPELVAVQRWLALASRVLHVRPDAADACVGLVERQAPELAVMFRVLLHIRGQGLLVHPAAGQPWHRAYLEQLLLAAHRTMKWQQAKPEQIRAAVAAASAATEQLDADNPFRHWNTDDVTAAVRTIVPLLPLDSDAAAQLLHELATAPPVLDAATDAVLAAARQRLVRVRSAERARELVVELGERHDDYVDLVATTPDAEIDAIDGVLAQSCVTLCGAPRSGKSTVLREIAYRLAAEILAPSTTPEIRVPVPVDAADILAAIGSPDAMFAGTGLADCPAAAFTLGAPYLLVDNVDRLDPAGQRSVLAYLEQLAARHPKLRMVVCRREPDEPLGRVLRLRELDLAGMRMFLRRALARERLRDSDIERLLRALLEEPEWQRLRPERPGMLAVIAHHVRRFGLPELRTPGSVIAEELLGGSQIAGELAYVCERVATWLLDERVEEIPLALVPWPARHDPDELLRHLVAHDLVQRAQDRISFVDGIYRDYFAARALQRNPAVTAVDRIRYPNWHSAIRIFVTMPGATTLAELVSRAWSVAPVLAGHLISDGRIADADLIGSFVAAQCAVLADDAADQDDLDEAAQALAAALHWPELRSVATETGHPVAARIAALRTMAAVHWRATATRYRCTRELGLAVARLLEAPCPEALRAVALDVIASNALRGLELHVGECVTATGPWPVVDGAIATLHELGTSVPARLTAIRQESGLLRLRVLDQELSGLTVISEARELRRQRIELLVSLSGPDAVAALLVRRFDFQTEPSMVTRLDELISDGHAGGILTGDVTPDEWVRLVVTGTPIDAAAAAHRLLRDAPAHAVRALAAIDADAPPHRLLIAAGIADAVGGAALDHAARLFGELSPVVDDRRMAAFAALLCAIYDGRRVVGMRLAWTTADVFTERDLAVRHRWEWTAALTRCRGGVAELTSLLADDDPLALAVLASWDFPRRCQTGRHLRFAEAIRQRVLDRVPDAGAGPECGRWALAAATMDLVEAVPLLSAMAAKMSPDRTDRWQPLADVLAALGYLARIADPTHGVMDVHRLLSDLDAQDVPSIQAGRVVGLAYLGDCGPLVRAAVDDPALGHAALNAIRLWTPGPCTPRSLVPGAELARWLADRRDQPGLPAAARTLLTRLTREAERTSGVLIPRDRTRQGNR